MSRVVPEGFSLNMATQTLSQQNQSPLFAGDDPEPVLVFGEDDPHAGGCEAVRGGVCDCLHDLVYSPSLHLSAR